MAAHPAILGTEAKLGQPDEGSQIRAACGWHHVANLRAGGWFQLTHEGGIDFDQIHRNEAARQSELLTHIVYLSVG